MGGKEGNRMKGQAFTLHGLCLLRMSLVSDSRRTTWATFAVCTIVLVLLGHGCNAGMMMMNDRLSQILSRVTPLPGYDTRSPWIFSAKYILANSHFVGIQFAELSAAWASSFYGADRTPSASVHCRRVQLLWKVEGLTAREALSDIFKEMEWNVVSEHVQEILFFNKCAFSEFYFAH